MKRIVEQTADTQTTSLKKIEGEGPDQKRKVKRKQKGKEYSECCKDATALAGISLMLVKAIFLFYYICSKLS